MLFPNIDGCSACYSPSMAWEITHPNGLNYIIHYPTKKTVFLVCENTKTGKSEKRFLFNVGQPLQEPPIHKLHKDIPAGKVSRVFKMSSINEICFSIEYEGNKYLIEYKSEAEKLFVYVLTIEENNPEVIPVLMFDTSKIPLKYKETEVWFTSEGIIYHRELTMDKKNELLSFMNNYASQQNYIDIIKIAVYANTCRDPFSGLLYTPVNRAWIEMMGRIHGYEGHFLGPLVFIWDVAFNSLLASQFDKDLAESNMRLLFLQQKPDGKLVQLRIGEKMNNLTGLPIVSYVIYKMYEKWYNKDFIEWIYPRLLSWHNWVLKNRDKNRDSLLEWGGERYGGGIEILGKDAGFYESGMDDSPMMEEAIWDDDLNCLRMNFVDFSSIFALDSLILSYLAKELKRNEESNSLFHEYQILSLNINEILWDDERKIYTNRHWDGKFAQEISPTSFYPMIAKIPTKERAKELIRKLLDENLFWGEYVIPSISRNSKYFSPDGDYWRGRVWSPINYIVYEGLKNYDPDVAEMLKEKSKYIFLREWFEHGHIHENYSCKTGRGEPENTTYARSCPMYTWGALLLLMSIE